RVVAVFFFFQAEDGVRDRNVTGVQTCALPISRSAPTEQDARESRRCRGRRLPARGCTSRGADGDFGTSSRSHLWPQNPCTRIRRSEERRVGKECRSRWASVASKKTAAMMCDQT